MLTSGNPLERAATPKPQRASQKGGRKAHGMQIARRVCAVVPVKDARHAKARLAGVLSGAQRTQLAHAMLEDVLIALAATAADLASILVVTVDRKAADRAA